MSHCLDLDIVSQGNSAEHALDMIKEAIELVVIDDLANNRQRAHAPDECWEVWRKILSHGKKFDPSEIGKVASRSGAAVWIAAQLYVTVHAKMDDRHAEYQPSTDVPLLMRSPKGKAGAQLCA